MRVFAVRTAVVCTALIVGGAAQALSAEWVLYSEDFESLNAGDRVSLLPNWTDGDPASDQQAVVELIPELGDEDNLAVNVNGLVSGIHKAYYDYGGSGNGPNPATQASWVVEADVFVHPGEGRFIPLRIIEDPATAHWLYAEWIRSDNNWRFQTNHRDPDETPAVDERVDDPNYVEGEPLNTHIKLELDLVSGVGRFNAGDNTSSWAPLNMDRIDEYVMNYSFLDTRQGASGSMDNFTITASDEPIYVSLPGDLNGDGFVGGDDLDIVRSFWGQNVTAGDLLSGDPSGDGFVGGDDLDIVRADWGQGTPPANNAVPEPAALFLLATGLLILVIGGKRKRIE